MGESPHYQNNIKIKIHMEYLSKPCAYIYVVLSIFDLRLIVHCIPQFLMSTSEVKRKQEVVIRRATPEDIARQILSYAYVS